MGVGKTCSDQSGRKVLQKTFSEYIVRDDLGFKKIYDCHFLNIVGQTLEKG